MTWGTEDDWRKAINGDGETSNSSHNLPKEEGVVAVDPGKTTGVALAKDGLYTFTMDFWEVYAKAAHGIWTDFLFIVEAPHITKWGKAQNNSAIAYNSGGVAREAELLVEGLEREGMTVIEHDPHSSGNSQWSDGKWDSATAHRIVGEWEGPDNEHTRDALRILLAYGATG